MNEESDDEQEEIFLRIKQKDDNLNLIGLSEETTRTNSHLGSLIIPHN